MKKTRRGPRFNRPDQSTLIAWLDGAVLGVHPACSVAQRISDLDLYFLVESIKEIGLLRPIEINREKLLVDGFCRILACYIAGVPITKKDIVISKVDPWAIASSNIVRRHESNDQKARSEFRLHAKELEAVADRKRAGATKSRTPKKSPLGAESAPSGNTTTNRRVRAIEKVANKQAVSRVKPAIAEKIIVEGGSGVGLIKASM